MNTSLERDMNVDDGFTLAKPSNRLHYTRDMVPSGGHASRRCWGEHTLFGLYLWFTSIFCLGHTTSALHTHDISPSDMARHTRTSHAHTLPGRHCGHYHHAPHRARSFAFVLLEHCNTYRYKQTLRIHASLTSIPSSWRRTIVLHLLTARVMVTSRDSGASPPGAIPGSCNTTTASYSPAPSA